MNLIEASKNRQQSLTLSDWAGSSSQVSTLLVLVYLVIVIAIFLHLSGILLLFSKLSEINNQTMLLMHYSVVSIILLCFNICTAHLTGSPRQTLQQHYHPADSVAVGFYTIHIAFIVNLLLLTIDRLALSFLNLKYSFVMSRKMFCLQIVIMWIVAVVYGLITKYVSPIRESSSVQHDVSFAYNGFVVTFTLLSYAAIFIRVRITPTSSASVTLSRDLFKRYLIPLFLVAIFFLLNLTPTIIERFVIVVPLTNYKEQRDVTLTLIGLNSLQLLFGPIIYVVLQRKMREKLSSLCHHCFHRISVYRTISENQINPVDAGFHDNLGKDSH